tara:strand:- start:1102 stop:1560 length:459 start_codon:yes stop_codon:yes gene_type:complete
MTKTIYGRLPDESNKTTIISASNARGILGVRYPLSSKGSISNGMFSKTSGLSLLKSELRQFIKTERGERVMLPNYGLSLRKYLFEPLTPEIVSAIREEIYFGVGRYLKKVSIRKVAIQEGTSISGLGINGIKVFLLVSEKNSTETSILEIEL